MVGIKVLDHGYVRLVDHMGSDLSIVRAARVSYDADWRAGEDEGKDAKLIHYLMKNRHSTPFESVTFTFEVKAPIFVFRQWHRHRTQCLAGDTKIIFERPCDGKSYPMTIGEVVRKWNQKEPKRQRQVRTLQDFNRERIGAMGLRGPEGTIHVTDAWFSGEKKLYKLSTKYGEVISSSDHVFNTPDGPMKLGDNPSHVLGMVQVGSNNSAAPLAFTSQEIAKEEWKEFREGYEVSTLGRIRSYYRQGSQYLHKEPVLKKITLNSSGRAVVGIDSKVYQVSRIVAERFLGHSDLPFVRHVDDNPHNNRINNLAYGTALDNSQDSYVNGGRRRLQCVPLKVNRISACGYGETFDLSVTGKHWFIANNLVVHNSYNEVSARYTELPDEMYIPDIEIIGKQSMHNKQVRTIGGLTQMERHKLELSLMLYERHVNKAYEVYQTLLNSYQWPRELARAVLPVAIYSKMFTTMNLHNLFHFLGLRLHAHAQHEIRVYAEAMLELIEPLVPIAVEAYKNNYPQA